VVIVNLYVVAQCPEHVVDENLQRLRRFAWALELDEQRTSTGDEEHAVGVPGLAGGGEFAARHPKHVEHRLAHLAFDFLFKHGAPQNSHGPPLDLL
jgi:hypothetical protein